MSATSALVDFDIVDESNLASQGYLERDFSLFKVEATAALCREINKNFTVESVPERFRRSMDTGNVLFSCVDRIAARRLIWDAVKDRLSFFADGRMTAEAIQVLAVCDTTSRTHYPTTLFAAEEAYAGSCTARTTIFTANIAAGLMIEQFTRWLRGLPIDADIQLNLLTSELTVAAS